jgi:hypothetical protein
VSAGQWRSRSALKLHITLVGGLTLCAVGSWVEWSRALDGRTIAWVYAFEWPLFAVLGTWIWWRLLHEDSRPRRSRRWPTRTGAGIPDDDPGLVAWREYLNDLGGADPPNGAARSPADN